eukprot:3216886-Karenia_brevis.AAC.1
MSDLEDNMSNSRDSNSEALVRAVSSERDREASEDHDNEIEIIQSRGSGEPSSQDQRIINNRRGEDDIGGIGNPLRPASPIEHVGDRGHPRQSRPKSRPRDLRAGNDTNPRESQITHSVAEDIMNTVMELRQSSSG